MVHREPGYARRTHRDLLVKREYGTMIGWVEKVRAFSQRAILFSDKKEKIFMKKVYSFGT